MENDPHKIAGIRASAFLETAIFFGVLLALDALFGAGERFAGVCPHPFWIIVLLLAAQYGTLEGLFGALAATLALLLFNLPEQTLHQSMYDYLFTVAITPILWLIAAVALGELRSKHIRERVRLQEALASAEEREEKITQTYQWTRELKERLELKVAGQLRSSVGAYKAAKAMESLSTQEVLRGLEELIGALMSPEKFSVYLMEGGTLKWVLSHGWRETEPYTREFPARADITAAVAGGRAVLTVSNSEHEKILGGQGVLAGPLLDKASGEVLGMLKIEKLGFTDLNVSTVEIFGAICEWAGVSIMNSRHYKTARASSMVNPEHNLYSHHYFARYSEHIAALGKRVGFDVTMLTVRLENADTLPEAARAAVARLLADAVDKVLRGIDMAFDYQESGEAYSIVLPATGREGAEIVLGKIRAALGNGVAAVSPEAQLAFSIQSLHGKQS